MLSSKNLGVIGAGNMGEAFIRGILKTCLVYPEQVIASRRNEEKLKKIRDELGIRITTDNKELLKNVDVVILGVKPQIMRDVLTETAEYFNENQIVISIAAGIKTSFIENMINKKIPVIRVMPNTPALVEEAVSAYCYGKYATCEHALTAVGILSTIGVTVQVEEEQMDHITAVSGTGPAYIFYILEALTEAAKTLGLPENLSRSLVKQTVYGAAKLVVETGLDPSRLRAQVTSPGGTTQAAIMHLESKDYIGVIKEAVQAASKRATELGMISSQVKQT